jgi:outer membrane immunogenic protein
MAFYSSEGALMKTTKHAILLAMIAAAGIGGVGSTSAADLTRPVPPAPVYVPPPFTWTAFYVGGNLGGAWAQGNVTDTLTALNFNSGNSNGVFVGGGQVGFNYQVSDFVLGAEFDFDWAGNNNNATGGVGIAGPLGLGHTFAVGVNDGWITTFTGRLGFVWNRALLYGKAGGAWVGNNGFTVTDVTSGLSVTGSSNNSNSGWTAGAGVEWAFANNWTVRAEYNYIGLGSRSFTVPATSLVLPGDTFTAGRNIQMVTVGINYLFH